MENLFQKILKALMSFTKLGENNQMYGKTFSAETITKQSIAKGGGIIYVYDTQNTLVILLVQKKKKKKKKKINFYNQKKKKNIINKKKLKKKKKKKSR
jgi:hypothetical protein